MQVAGQVLQRCMYSVQGRQGSFPYSSIGVLAHPHGLKIDGTDGAELSQSLQALLASLMPAQQPLHCLHLSSCRLQPGALQGCSALGTVSELKLWGCCSPAAGLNDALAMLLQHTPRLERLTIERCLQWQPFPAALLGPPFCPFLTTAWRTCLRGLAGQVSHGKRGSQSKGGSPPACLPAACYSGRCSA